MNKRQSIVSWLRWNLNMPPPRLVQAVPVQEEFRAQVIWDGVVHVFDIEGTLRLPEAYAWSSPIENSDRRRIFAAPQIGAVKRPWMRSERLSGWSTRSASVITDMRLTW